MMQGLLFAVIVFLAGFGFGYGLRAYLSHRRRLRARRERNFGMPAS